MEFLEQAGSVLNEVVDVLLVDVAKLLGSLAVRRYINTQKRTQNTGLRWRGGGVHINRGCVWKLQTHPVRSFRSTAKGVTQVSLH